MFQACAEACACDHTPHMLKPEIMKNCVIYIPLTKPKRAIVLYPFPYRFFKTVKGFFNSTGTLSHIFGPRYKILLLPW